MQHEEIMRRLRAATVEVYQLGLTVADPLIPPVEEDCRSVPAGPVHFVVETRHLTDSAVDAVLGVAPTGDEDFDEYGGTVHVHGADDGLEYLRFDCFEDKPHYHYAHPDGRSTVVRIDQHAEGDPIEWTLSRLRNQLAEMLDYAGAADLANLVRTHREEVLAAVSDVERLLREARDQARARHSSPVAGA